MSGDVALFPPLRSASAQVAIELESEHMERTIEGAVDAPKQGLAPFQSRACRRSGIRAGGATDFRKALLDERVAETANTLKRCPHVLTELESLASEKRDKQNERNPK